MLQRVLRISSICSIWLLESRVLGLQITDLLGLVGCLFASMHVAECHQRLPHVACQSSGMILASFASIVALLQYLQHVIDCVSPPYLIRRVPQYMPTQLRSRIILFAIEGESNHCLMPAPSLNLNCNHRIRESKIKPPFPHCMEPVFRLR